MVIHLADTRDWFGRLKTLMLLSVPLPIVVNFGSTGMIYVGQVTGTDMPDGHGYMYQPNGDL